MVQFSRFTADNVTAYWLVNANDEYYCAYYPPADIHDNSVSLSAALQNGGDIVFLQTTVTNRDAIAFTGELKRYLAAEYPPPSPNTAALIWLFTYPGKPWEAYRIAMDKNTGRVDAYCLFTLGGYALGFDIENTAPFEADETADCIVMNPVQWPGTFYTPEGSALTARLSSVRFHENTAGTLCFSLRFENGADAFRSLSVRMDYYHKGDAVTRYSFSPVLPENGFFSLCCYLHPSKPLDPQHTRMETDGSLCAKWNSGYRFTDGAPMAFHTEQLRFCFEKAYSPHGEDLYYIAPSGTLDIIVDGTELSGSNAFLHDSLSRNDRSLILGMNGYESLSVDSKSMKMTFVSGKPAFIEDRTITARATTPWVAFSQDPSIPKEYYLHPPHLWGYETGRNDTFINYAGQPHKNLLQGDATDVCFPHIPQQEGSISSESLTAQPDAVWLNDHRLLPLRQEIFNRTGLTPLPRGEQVCATGYYAYSAAADGNSLLWLGIAHENAGVIEGIPSMAFTYVSGAMRDAFASPNPFIVMAEPDTVLGCCSVPYKMTDDILSQLENHPDMTTVNYLELKKKFVHLDYLFTSEGEFVDRLCLDVPGLLEREIAVILDFCSAFTISWQGFTFSFSPRSLKRSTSSALLIFKYHTGASLEELIGDTATWKWPEAAGDVQETQDRILSLFQTIRAENAPEYRDFLDIISNKSYCGMLALDCPCRSRTLPAEISDIGFRADLNSLTARYISVDCAQAVGHGESGYQLQTRITAFIDYRNPAGMNFADPSTLDFCVSRIMLALQNNRVVLNRCRALLKISDFFGSPATLLNPTEGQALSLSGSRQWRNGRRVYDFALCGNGEFTLYASPVESVEITGVSATSSMAGDTETITFLLGGRLRFWETHDFDAFSYGRTYDEMDNMVKDGYLKFSNMQIFMGINLHTGAISLSRSMRALSVQTNSSIPRAQSLNGKFPAYLKEILFPYSETDDTQNASPASLGYTAIQTPIEQTQLGDIWYGLVWEIDLNSCGLFALTGLRLRLLTAWSFNNSASDDMLHTECTASYYTGIQFITQSGASFAMELNLFDVMKLNFKSIEFKIDIDKNGNKCYSLHFRNFGLRLFSISLPPGHNTLSLYANPDQSDPVKLGWYTAYSKQ